MESKSRRAGIVGEGPSAGGSSSGATRTLDEVMRAPSTNTPDVIVLETAPGNRSVEDELDPEEDLWLSSADG